MATRTKKPDTAEEPHLEPKASKNHFAGMEPPSHPAIDEAAEAYYDLIAKGFKIRNQAATAKASLLEVMVDHKLKFYTYDNKEVVVEDDLNVKVKKKKKEEE